MLRSPQDAYEVSGTALSVIVAGATTPDFGAVSPASGRHRPDRSQPAAPLRPLMQLVEQVNEPTSRRRLLRQCARRSANRAPEAKAASAYATARTLADVENLAEATAAIGRRRFVA